MSLSSTLAAVEARWEVSTCSLVLTTVRHDLGARLRGRILFFCFFSFFFAERSRLAPHLPLLSSQAYLEEGDGRAGSSHARIEPAHAQGLGLMVRSRTLQVGV